MTDLPNDPRFCHLPYVVGPPYFRFYAGTPLISPEGLRIGSLFVIDDRVHAAPHKADIDFLGVMAANVMKHLEGQKVTRDQVRQTSMSRGLAAFVEGKSRIPDQWQPDQATPKNSLRPQSRQRKLPKSEEPDYDNEQTLNQERNSPVEGQESEDLIEAVGRASNILRESLDTSYTVFLDTSSDGNAVMETPTANVVAFSSDQEPTTPKSFFGHALDKKVLRLLCSRYPLGKIWSYREDGTFEFDDQEPMDLSRDNPPGLFEDDDYEPDYRKRLENAKIIRCFPNARQILFVPLWDSAKPDYASACFAVSEHEVPLFTTTIEVAFVRAFINSLNVLCGRISATVAEKQKTDFISSMSHVCNFLSYIDLIPIGMLTSGQELRSPLHGIVASTELLLASALTPFQHELCEMVDLCGQTLLDTISQILDFTKVLIPGLARSLSLLIPSFADQ